MKLKISDEALAVAAAINKKHGADTIVLASKIRTDLIPRVPSGSLALDVVLGGGWPGNQWHELIGEPSHGKSALALKTIAKNQALDPNWTAVWVAAEGWAPQWARDLGVDTDRVLIVETNIMEEAYDAAVDFAGSRTVDCIVIDSLPALMPTMEDEKELWESVPGRRALLTGSFFRKVGQATKRSLVETERPVLGLMVNQWRSKIGVLHGDPRTTPGGQGKDYAYWTRVEVRRDEWLEVGTGQDKRRIGQAIKFRTIKNKSAAPHQVGVVDFYFADGGPVRKGEFDFAKEIVALAVANDIIERKGAWYYLGDAKWQGTAPLLVNLREEPALRERVEREVLDLLRAAHLAA
jgi:recombination protein RecA